MKHDFRLRKASEVRVLTSDKTSVSLKIIHSSSILAVLASVVPAGILFLNFDKYLNQDLEVPVTTVEKRETPKYDKYGGWKKVKGEARGIFSIQEINGKQTLVTPDGNSFFMAAVNKVWPWTLDDQVFKEKYNNSTVRWAREIAPFLDSLHFMIGHQSELPALRHRTVLRLPYVVQAKFVGPSSDARTEPEDFPDVWSPEYDAMAYEEAERIGRVYGGDPYFVLSEMGNELEMNLQEKDGSQNDRAKWWWLLLSAEGETPAKDHWEELMAERYTNDIAALNTVYGTSLTSFEELSDLGLSLFDRFKTIEEGEEEDAKKSFLDITDFHTDIGEQFHKVGYTYLKQFIPNSIIGSEALGGGIYSDQYFTKIAPYIDVLLFHQYLEAGKSPDPEIIDRYASLTGHPTVITEHSYTMFPCNGGYPSVPTQADRATAHLTWRNGIVQNPKVLGFGWHELNDVKDENISCGYINFGLRDRQDNPYQEMIDAGKAGWEDYNELRWKIAPLGETGSTPARDPLNPLTNTEPIEDFEPITETDQGLKPLEPTGGATDEAPTLPFLSGYFSELGKR